MLESAGLDGLRCRILNESSTIILGVLARRSKSQKVRNTPKESNRVREVSIFFFFFLRRRSQWLWKFQAHELNIDTWEQIINH